MSHASPLPLRAAFAAAEPDFSAAELQALWKKNRQQLCDSHRTAQPLCDGQPAHLKIELTNYCNLSCPICPHSQMQRAVGYMAPELFRRIIDQSLPSLEFAYLHHLGESLFHGQIGELIRYGRQRGVHLGLSTNATYLDGRKGRLLLENGLDFLVISLDGASEASYQRQRVGGDFATTVENVRRFFRLKEQLPNRTTVVVQLIVTDENRHEIERFSADWDGQVMIKQARDWAGQVTLGRRAAPSPTSDSPCRMLWSELTVLWDGTVVPCANVFEKQNVLGDLGRQSLAEIWNGAPMQALRRAHLENRVATVPVCAGCPRHEFAYDEFVAVDQLTQRLKNYVRTDLTPRPGLS